MYVAWTTVANAADATTLAKHVVERQLAACVQIDGPITSIYTWKGRMEENSEYRLCFKCTPSKLTALETEVLAHHPYETPEWIVVRADRVGEKYLSWAEADSSTPPL